MEAFDQHGGLGWLPVVVDPRLSAPRGMEHTNTALQEGYEGGDSLFEGEHDQPDDTVKATMDTPLPETNVGFQLLLKMGWIQGKGLGRNEDGIVDPIRSGVEEGVRLGLGKQEQDDFFTATENVQRKRLETEIQASEDEARKERREALAEREAKIKEEVKEILQTFYCKTCHKQYSSAMELDAHLSSYDHHHRKRLVELKAMSNERTRSDRAKKEAKQMEKELAQLHKQIERAAANKGASPSPPPLPPQPPPEDPASGAGVGAVSASGYGEDSTAPQPPPPPPPVTGSGITFGLGGIKRPGVGRGAGAIGGRRGGRMISAGRGAPAAGAFTLSDSDEEGKA